METIRLNIKRDKSTTGCAMSYRIIVGGKEVTKPPFVAFEGSIRTV